MKAKDLDFEKILKEKGLKLTKQRLQIFKEIVSKGGHFEIEDFVQRLRSKGIKVSRATIYRTLTILKDIGFVKEVVKFGNKTYYETGTKDHHDHLICLSCGKFIEFHEDDIEKIQENICARYKFKPVYHRLEIYGICENCNKKNQDKDADY